MVELHDQKESRKDVMQLFSTAASQHSFIETENFSEEVMEMTQEGILITSISV